MAALSVRCGLAGVVPRDGGDRIDVVDDDSLVDAARLIVMCDYAPEPSVCDTGFDAQMLHATLAWRIAPAVTAASSERLSALLERVFAAIAAVPYRIAIADGRVDILWAMRGIRVAVYASGTIADAPHTATFRAWEHKGTDATARHAEDDKTHHTSRVWVAMLKSAVYDELMPARVPHEFAKCPVKLGTYDWACIEEWGVDCIRAAPA